MSRVRTLDTAAILENARRLVPEIRAATDRIEAERRIPEDLLASLTTAGVFRIAMPEARGGPEMDPVSQIEMIEVLSRADASVGWVVCITSDSGFYSAFLDDDTAVKLYPSLDARTAGLLFPAGQAHVVDGGFQVTGRWAFGSGSLHADCIVGGAIVLKDGEPIMADSGIPEFRTMFLPISEVEIIDTWHTTGLAGSGSNDYRVDDVFVPARHSFSIGEGSKRSEPLYAYHGTFFSNVPGVPLGLARAAIDQLHEVALEKTVPPDMHLLRDEYRVQEALGQAEGQLRAARALVYDVMGDMWTTLCAGRELSMDQRTQVGLMIVHSIRTGLQVVQLMYETAGSSAIYRRNPLDRSLRDMQTVAAHVVGQKKTYATVGQMMLGLKPSFMFF